MGVRHSQEDDSSSVGLILCSPLWASLKIAKWLQFQASHSYCIPHCWKRERQREKERERESASWNGNNNGMAHVIYSPLNILISLNLGRVVLLLSFNFHGMAWFSGMTQQIFMSACRYLLHLWRPKDSD